MGKFLEIVERTDTRSVGYELIINLSVSVVDCNTC